MTFFGDVYFFVWLGIFIVPALILGAHEKNIKYYGSLVSLFFIILWGIDNPKGLVYLVIYCIWEFALIQIMLKLANKYVGNKIFFWVFVLLSMSPLICFKISGLLGHSIFGCIGISYMTFKSLQIIIEIYDGLIEECKLFDFLYFQLIFTCLLSGPIDRSRRFTGDLYNVMPKQEYLENAGDGLFHLCLGLLYKFVFASAFYQGMTYLGSGDYWWSHAAYMYCYGFYLFFDFAGYGHMAVGTGHIFGIKVPMAFDKPFMSVDMKDFWDRWNITLSHWFRDFLFSRFMMAAIRGRWFKSKLTGASIGFMINMTLMGIWHGLSWSYILYGVYHGVLLSITEIYQKKSKFYKKNKKKRWYRILSAVITFNLVMFGFYIFSGKFLEVL